MSYLTYSIEFDSCLNDGEHAQLTKMITKQGGRITLGEYDETKGVEVVLVRDLSRDKIQKIAEAVALEKLHGVFLN